MKNTSHHISTWGNKQPKGELFVLSTQLCSCVFPLAKLWLAARWGSAINPELIASNQTSTVISKHRGFVCFTKLQNLQLLMSVMF